MRHTSTLAALFFLALAAPALATEFHVAPCGDNTADGSADHPLKTIQAAAEKAQAGDTITVHAGTYREWVKPPRGGSDDAHRIVYQAAKGEKVTITGSEPAKGWTHAQGDVWKVTLPAGFFHEGNPFDTLIKGGWFQGGGRKHHTASVFLGTGWLTEAATLAEVMKPRTGKETNGLGDPAAPLWFAAVGADGATEIHAQFPGVDPNASSVEVASRPTVFTPVATGVNYITVRGFDLRNAATQWAGPCAGQRGLVTAYWNKGWIIEDNEIHHSRCCGIALGKYSDPYDGKRDSTAGYQATIQDALKKGGWNREKIGSHIVRNNRIHDCEQTGIVGSLGCAFSTIEGNEISDIHVIRTFSGAEISGIKFHGAIDVVIKDNHIYHSSRGVWLDWMAQGTQVTGNLMHDNGVGELHGMQDFFPEVDHGPMLFANNILLSVNSQWCQSQGIAYAHNFFAGTLNAANSNGDRRPDPRVTPFFKPHSTHMEGNAGFQWGDWRYVNNLFTFDPDRRPAHACNSPYCDAHMIPNVGYDLNLPEKFPARKILAQGNVYLKGAPPYKAETDALVKPDFDPAWKLVQKADGWYLSMKEDAAWRAKRKRPLVTTEPLGLAAIPQAAFENPDGSPLAVDTDYFGKPRDKSNPFPGPFETPVEGEVKVWPKK